MQEAYNKKHSRDLDNEIDLRELFNVLLERKWTIVSFTGIISVLAVILSLSLPNIYESKALLVPVNPSSGISGAIRGYSGLAGLAGISLPPGVDDGNSIKAMEKISSLSFFENKILINIHLPDLMALKAWDSKTNTLIFDEKKYDTKNSAWIRKFKHPQKQIPSAQESFEVFIKKHLNLSEDKKTGFITLSIKHQSPYIAKQWLDLIVFEVNNFYRQKDKLESEKSVNFLNQQISMTDLSEIKEVLAQLLQEETKKLTLIEANAFYVFEYIDPPAVMEEKSSPSRALICIFLALFGGILSTFYVIIKHYFFIEKVS